MLLVNEIHRGKSDSNRLLHKGKTIHQLGAEGVEERKLVVPDVEKPNYHPADLFSNGYLTHAQPIVYRKWILISFARVLISWGIAWLQEQKQPLQ